MPHLSNPSAPLIVSIFISSFLGSWHCAVMCGPICLAIGQRGSLWPYHLGRLISYTAAGALAGWMGQRLLWSQNSLVRYLGFFFIASGFLWLSFDLYRQKTPTFAKKIWQKILRWQNSSKILLGVLSVFLPCGWLFYFLLAATATQSPWTGSLVLFLLWLGSLPALAGSQWLMRHRLRKAQPHQQKIATLLITLSGLYALLAYLL